MEQTSQQPKTIKEGIIMKTKTSKEAAQLQYEKCGQFPTSVMLRVLWGRFNTEVLAGALFSSWALFIWMKLG